MFRNPLRREDTVFLLCADIFKIVYLFGDGYKISA